MKLATAVEVTVVEERADGRGGVIRIPIVPETPFIDFGRTSGKGSTGSISVSDLLEMVENFGRLPGPVPVSSGGHSGDRGGKSPGFMDSVQFLGNALWADIDLGPELWKEVVVDRAWRAFSIEAALNLKKPTIDLKGWTLTGGTFTNQPATNVHFRIAASEDGIEPDAVATVAIFQGHARATGRQESEMADEKVISLSSHEARIGEVEQKLTASNEQVKDLNSANRTLTESAQKARARAEEAQIALATATTELNAAVAINTQKDAQLGALRREREALQIALTEAEQKGKADSARALSVDVKSVVSRALDAGVPPAVFDGHEADPAAWMTANYASLESFEKQIKSLHGIVKLSSSPAPSGSNPNADATPKDEINPADAVMESKLKAMGLDVNYDGITNEADARKAFEASKSKV